MTLRGWQADLRPSIAIVLPPTISPPTIGHADGCRAALPSAVRADHHVPLPVPAPDDRVGSRAGFSGIPLVADRRSDLSAGRALLDQDVRHQLRVGRGDRHRDGVRIRHELGGLLPLRRRCVWLRAGRRGHFCFLSRVGFSGGAALRVGQGLAGIPSVCRVHGLLGEHFLVDLDRRGQLLAADAGRPSSGRAAFQRAHVLACGDRRFLGDGAESLVRAAPAACLVRRVCPGRLLRHEHFRVVSAAGAAWRVRPAVVHRQPASRHPGIPRTARVRASQRGHGGPPAAGEVGRVRGPL